MRRCAQPLVCAATRIWLNCSEGGSPYSDFSAANVFKRLFVYRSDTFVIPCCIHQSKFSSGITKANVDVGINREEVGVDKDLYVTNVFQENKDAITGGGKSLGLY